ncbi:MAG: DUF2975 domain-containing protein [Clostridia bacterium]|nr:DUF2975 domain-containing protein [Clostridia bacterium]
MSHKTLSKLLLIAGIIACIGGCTVFFLYAPMMAHECAEIYPELSHFALPLLLYIWVIAAMYILAVALYMRISLRLGKNQSFCSKNADDLRSIALFLCAAAVLWFLLIFLTGWVGLDIGPAVLLFLLASMATLAVALVAYVLSRLVRRAAALQAENDLTI